MISGEGLADFRRIHFLSVVDVSGFENLSGEGRMGEVEKLTMTLIDALPLGQVNGRFDGVCELDEAANGFGNVTDAAFFEDGESCKSDDPFPCGDLGELGCFFGDENIPVPLQKIELHGPDQGHFEFRDFPRLGDVAVDAAVVHGICG